MWVLQEKLFVGSSVLPCTFPSILDITVIRSVFLILNVDTHSELAYVFANIFLAFLFGTTSPFLSHSNSVAKDR